MTFVVIWKRATVVLKYNKKKKGYKIVKDSVNQEPALFVVQHYLYYLYWFNKDIEFKKSNIIWNLTNTSKKLLNILYRQNEETNLNLQETFSNHFGSSCVTSESFLRQLAHVSIVYRRADKRPCSVHRRKPCYHFCFSQHDQRQSWKPKYANIWTRDVLQRDFRQITECKQFFLSWRFRIPTIKPQHIFLTYFIQKNLKTTLVLHTYLTRILLYIIDFLLWKSSPLPAFLVDGEQLTLRKLFWCWGNLRGGNGVFITT